MVFKTNYTNSIQINLTKKIMTTIKMTSRYIQKMIIAGNKEEITITINTKNQNGSNKTLNLTEVSLNGLCWENNTITKDQNVTTLINEGVSLQKMRIVHCNILSLNRKPILLIQMKISSKTSNFCVLVRLPTNIPKNKPHMIYTQNDSLKKRKNFYWNT